MALLEPLGRQAVRGVRGFVAHLEGRGIERRIVGTEVVLWAQRGRVDPWYADALRSGIARLVIGIERGKPVVCELPGIAPKGQFTLKELVAEGGFEPPTKGL